MCGISWANKDTLGTAAGAGDDGRASTCAPAAGFSVKKKKKNGIITEKYN